MKQTLTTLEQALKLTAPLSPRSRIHWQSIAEDLFDSKVRGTYRTDCACAIEDKFNVRVAVDGVHVPLYTL